MRGRIVERNLADVLLDVQGVAYEVEIPLTTAYELPEVGEETVLFTHLVVREDAHLLFGFRNADDRTLFRQLIRVKGVGPKLAISILSGIEVNQLVTCINAGDARTLVAVPGVGKRTAEQIILDLKDRLAPVSTSSEDRRVAPGDAMADAETALIGLGYKPQEAARALARLDDQGADVETLLRDALKILASGG